VFQGLAIPFAIETQRPNLVRIPVRNLVATTGDDITFAVQVYEPDGTCTDISGCAVTVTIMPASEDPGSWGRYGGGYGSTAYGGDGYDYGWGWCTSRDRIVFQGQAVLTDPECGQAIATIPREVNADWRGRYRMLVSLDSEYGGSVQTYGILDVRRGARVARLGAAGYVSIADAFLIPYVGPLGGLLDGVGIIGGMASVASFAGIGTLATAARPVAGLLDAVGVADGTAAVGPPLGIGIIDGTQPGVGGVPYAGPQVAVFVVSLDVAAQQTVTVHWMTVDGTAHAGVDYAESEGTLTFRPGDTAKAIRVPVRAYNGSQSSSFSVHLSASNGAVIVQADGTATIGGFVGILDDVFLVNGPVTPFVPGLVGVIP
jgi:hypothetical protein